MTKKTERAFCNLKCGRETTWTGRKRMKCEGCGSVFPCPHTCEHYDCREARGDLVVNELGVYQDAKTDEPLRPPVRSAV